MKNTVSQVNAFVLHSRSFRENSQIIQLFSSQSGRFSVVAKGIKGARSQARKATLQPFHELMISFTGKSELKTLVDCEFNWTQQKEKPHPSLVNLQGKKLACGYYANELLLRACPEGHEYPSLYQSYCSFIQALKLAELDHSDPLPPLLRNFEFATLSAIGIAPDCEFDLANEPIHREQYYALIPQAGFSRVEISESSTKASDDNNSLLFPGEAILSLASGNYKPHIFKSVQQLMSILLSEVIGNKPLQSRKMWQHFTP